MEWQKINYTKRRQDDLDLQRLNLNRLIVCFDSSLVDPVNPANKINMQRIVEMICE
jgi:hypothetical protein